ncbi:MAG: phosphatidate cytidylyltransferase [Magnetococcales bacterium]|nr:phosphatidate cytidylyltransferase [Magnetococcales bacterium]
MFKRILSGSALAPLLILLLLAGSRVMLFPLLMLAALFLLWEWVRLHEAISVVVFAPLLGAVWLLLGTGFMGHADWIGMELVLILGLLLSLGLIEYQPGMVITERIGFRFMGVVYCGVPLLLLDGIRGMEHGGSMICFLLIIIWFTDSGAYFVGRKFGRRKISPIISPNKTWAGFWGGTGLGLVAGVGSVMVFKTPFSLSEGMLLGLVLSLSGQVGDFVESLFKRESGVKDSGQLIPGHGGLLDRLDSLLFAIPVFAGYLQLRESGLIWGALGFGG